MSDTPKNQLPETATEGTDIVSRADKNVFTSNVPTDKEVADKIDNPSEEKKVYEYTVSVSIPKNLRPEQKFRQFIGEFYGQISRMFQEDVEKEVRDNGF